jgi:glycyl-tRNA synthetase
VVETSIGLDRTVLMILSEAYHEEEVPTSDPAKTDTRTVMRFPAHLAPTKLAILPLVKKDGLPEIARGLMDQCKGLFYCVYEEKDSIGKRYRRQDAIGTPFCVTVDHQTKEDSTVTIRYRDSLQQQRVPLANVASIVSDAVKA